MSWFERPHNRAARIVAASLAVAMIAGCTVQPLRGSATSGASGTVSAAMASTEVAPVTTRAGQQVRNALIFALHGGEQRGPSLYRVRLGVSAVSTNLSVLAGSLAPTSAQLIMTTRWSARELASNTLVASGRTRVVAAFDKTSQSFANERAERDAENRAAKETAERIRLALGQKLSTR